MRVQWASRVDPNWREVPEVARRATSRVARERACTGGAGGEGWGQGKDKCEMRTGLQKMVTMDGWTDGRKVLPQF